MTHTMTRQLTIRLTAEQDANLQALRARWGTSQEATIHKALQEALERLTAYNAALGSPVE